MEGTGTDALYIIEGNGVFGVRVEADFGTAGDEGFYVCQSNRQFFTRAISPPLEDRPPMIREDAVDFTSNFYAIELDIGASVNALFRTGRSGGNRSIQLFDEEGNPIQDDGEGIWLRVTRVEPVDVFQ